MVLIANHRSFTVWLSIAAALMWLLGSSVPAAACSCRDPGAPADAFAKADAVFTGTVRNVTEDQARSLTDFTLYQGLDFTVDVDRVWKGKVLPREEMTTALGSAACGYPVQVGTKYLFYADRTPTDSNYYTWLCAGTVEYSKATDDLRHLASSSARRQTPLAIAAIATLIAVLIYGRRSQQRSAA